MPDNGNSTIRPARPTIAVGGQDKSELSDGLLSLAVIESTSGLYRCEATFANWGTKDGQTTFTYFDRQLLDFGKGFQVKVGTSTLFDGKITALEGHFLEGQQPQITVMAEDRFQDLRMTRRTRTFQDVSDSEVIQQIASDHGLSPSLDIQGPTYKVLAQTNQSDLAFVRERARTVDAELWMEGNTLHAKAHSGRNDQTVQLTQGAQLRSFSVSADLSGQSTSVAVNGWDVSSKSGLQYEASESTISSELNGDKSGASILQSAFGERKQALAHTVPLNSREAQTTAETFFKRAARRFLVGRGVAQTDSPLRVGTYVDLQGLGGLFSGKYYVAEARHLFDNRSGFRTEFTGERPGLGQGS